jgi:O-antigen/teichoic acid export membrane protein
MMRRLKAERRRLVSSRILRDSSVLMLGDWVAQIISIVTSIALGRTLGPDNYGLILIAMTSVNIIAQFMDVRTSEALIRFMGGAMARDDRREARTFFSIGFAVDIVVALVTIGISLLVALPLVGAHPQGETLRAMVNIYLLTAPLSILQNNFRSVLITFKQFRLKTLIVIAVVWGYVAAAFATFILMTIAATWLLLRRMGVGQAGDYRGALRQFLPFTFHTSLMGSLKAVSNNLDMLLLGALRPPSEVSFYRIARSAVSLIALPVSPVTTVLYPTMNEAWARRDLARVKGLIKRFMLYSGVVCLGALVFFTLTADTLVRWIYGEDFQPAAPLILLMAVGLSLEAVAGWVRTAALANGKPQLVTFSGTAAFLFRFALAIPLIFILGATGAALAYNVGVIVSVSVNAIYVLPRIGLWSLFSVKAS